MNRVVFAVDGQQRFALPAGFGGDQVACGYETFLVRQSDGLAGFDRFVSGFQSGDTYDGADHEIGVGMGRDPYRSSRSVHDVNGAAQSGLVQPVAELIGGIGGRHRQDLWAPASCLLKSEFDVVAGRHADHGEAVGKALDDAEGALADGTSGAEDGDAFHECESRPTLILQIVRCENPYAPTVGFGDRVVCK